MRKKHFIFFKGPIETLNHKIDETCKGIDEMEDCDYYIANAIDNKSYTCAEFYDYISQPDVYAFLFNQIGLWLNLSNGKNLWDEYGIPVYTFIVDHPRTFSNELQNIPLNLNVIVMDRKWIDFIRRFYPEVKDVIFIPQGGAESAEVIPYLDRDIEVLYAGSNQAFPIEYPKIYEFEDGGVEFYRFTIQLLLEQSSLSTEEVIELYFSIMHPEFEITDDFLRELNALSAFPIERTVRREYKFKIISALDKKGIKVEIYGNCSSQEK